jgi:hypothetical protein
LPFWYDSANRRSSQNRFAPWKKQWVITGLHFPAENTYGAGMDVEFSGPADSQANG